MPLASSRETDLQLLNAGLQTALPAELTSRRNWLLWRLVHVPGQPKPRKVPFYANGRQREGTQGDAADRASLATYEEAMSALRAGNYSGLGFALLPECGIVALDFDNCVEAGRIDPHVEAVCEGTYTEFSPSGKGVRAFFLGSLLSKKDADAKRGPFAVELFGHNGFVTVTGNVTPTCDLFGWSCAVTQCTPPVYEMYRSRGWDAAASIGETGESDALMRVAPTQGLTREQIAALLADIPNDLDYDTWISVGMALHQETQGRGFDLWDAWSRTSPKYTTETYGRARWESFGRYSGGNQVTIATVQKLAREARGADRADGGRVDMTDSGNVNALFEETRGDLRYIVERKHWMRWTGNHTWFVDESGGVAAAAAQAVAERYLRTAKDLEADAERATGDDRKRLLKLAESNRAWANRCRNRNGVDNMLSLATRDSRFTISASALDRDRWALGVANGVVDLNAGRLRESSRDDYITKCSPIAFNPNARAPRWERFIDEITALPGSGGQFLFRPELADYLRRAVGYWATGSVQEQKMFVAVGEGSNGKSVLFDVLAEILGPYCVAIPADAMMATGRDNDGERPTPFARRLAGARLACGTEAREGQKLNAAWVKKQTGDATITARGLHENAYTFETTHKLALLTNHEPHLDHMDHAARGRIHTIPFDVRWNRPGVPSRDPRLPDGDKGLMQALRAEAEGILAWVVRGAVAYAQQGLEPPQEVAARTLAYFQDQDAFAQWFATMERCPAKSGTGAAMLFAAFQAWCTEEGITDPAPSTQRAFSKALQMQGVDSVRVSSGTCWGLRAPVNEVAALFG